jgi:hypothetical protein
MPWYYAGPEARPVGPVSLEELHARRISGAIQPETYIIEDTGQADPARAWKRYRDVFPANPGLPPIPTPALFPPAPPLMPVSPPPAPTAQPHPLFPSAAGPGRHPVFTAPAGPDPYYSAQKTNTWCAWSLGLGLASPWLVPFCFLGTLMALVSIFMGVGGFAQAQGHRQQSGRSLAVVGILVSLLALALSLAVLVWLGKFVQAHMIEQTTTEQTSNDSE